jgi:hypothetical protein
MMLFRDFPCNDPAPIIVAGKTVSYLSSLD